MRKLEHLLTPLRDLGYPRSEICLTGSFALAMLSEVAEERGLEPLLAEDRMPGDIDVLTTNRLFHRAARGIATYHGIGVGGCLNIDMGESHFELTNKWPYALEDTSLDIESISIEVKGFRVMKPEAIAKLKERFARPKDLKDLIQLQRALRVH